MTRQLAMVLLGFALEALSSEAPNVALPHEAYVWQRSWNASLTQALKDHGPDFVRLIVLNAEVTWKDGRPTTVQVPLDFPTLAKSSKNVGLALRIGPFSGPFSPKDVVARSVAELARSLVSDAQQHGIDPCELQIDFACAESKLAGYCIWVEGIRDRIAPVPVTITALPSWLKQPAFKELVAACDSYVLQVHSLERPREISTAFSLCDPKAALKAVEEAASFHKPFRVALPTYGYQVAYDARGRFAGLAAEGTARTWPEGTELREVRADPLAMAGLVQIWTTNHPNALRGILWYRFPVSDDILNWRWATLSAIMAARSPKENFRAEPRRVEPGLVEISLVNNGELDISSRLALEVRWSRDGGARLLAADGLRGFEMVDEGSSAVQFKTKSQRYRLPAGQSQVVGWLRFNEDREVQVEVRKL